MTKPDDTNFNRIMAGLGEVLDIAEGRAAPARVYVPEDMDVRAIRAKLGRPPSRRASGSAPQLSGTGNSKGDGPRRRRGCGD